jgi:hypothetical protein
MHPFLLTSAIILLSVSSLAQKLPEATLTQQDYTQKSIRQNRTGNILALSGAGLILVGAVFPRGDLVYSGFCLGIFCDTRYENEGVKTAFIVAGAGSALASIPFYIAARKNRKRAAALALAIESTNYAYEYTFVRKPFPAIRLNVDL